MEENKLTDREIWILKTIFIASSHFIKMAITPEDERSVYQKELSDLFDKLDRITD